MLGLIARYLLDVGVEGCVETGGFELGLSELCETLLVEVVLEVLEGEGVLEDVG